jgi:hypothetical protein
MEQPTIEFTDRYQATGIPYPDENSCSDCDGMGCYPVKAEELNRRTVESPTRRLLVIGQTEEDGSPMEDDGWIIVQCPICNGTRKKDFRTDAEKRVSGEI